MECNAVRNSPEANPPAAEEKSGWDRVRSVVLRRGWNVGKKVAIVGAVVSSAPVMVPPLLFFSTLGFAVAFPFGVYYASFACTDLLMRSLLGLPNGEQEEEEEEEFFVPEEEMESEGDKEEEEIVGQLEIEEKGNGWMVEEEEKQREEAGMGEGKEVAEDKKEEERGGGMFPYDVNLVPLVLVYPDAKYPSEVYDGWNRGDIATEDQLMEEMKMREETQVENEKDQEILVSSQYPSAAEDGRATLGAETGGEEKAEEEVGRGEQMEAKAEVKEQVGLDAATLKSEESLRSDDEELEEREAKVAPSSEHASDAKGGGNRGDVGLVGKERDYGGGGEVLEEQQVTEGVGLREEGDKEDKKEEEENVGNAACETEGLLSISSTVTVMPDEYKIETDPTSGLASNFKETENSGGIGLLEEDKPMEEMKMGEELGEQWKGKKEDSVSSTLEHENKIKQSTLSLEYVLAFEKGYEGAVGIMEEEELIEEVGLAEAYAVEKGYERDVGIKEEEKLAEVELIEAHAVVEKGYQGNVGIGEEKLTEEVAFGDAFEVEKAYEKDVDILEEEKQTLVGLGEAYIVEKRYEGGDVIMDKEKLFDEVGLGEAHVLEVKGYGGDVGILEEEKPTEEVGLTEATVVEEKRYEGSVGIMGGEKPTNEVGLGEAYAVEEKRYEGDVGVMEEGKPIEKVRLGEATAVEEKRYEGDVSIIEEQRSTAEVGFGEAYATEKKGYEGDVGTMDKGKLIEEEGLEEVCAVEEKGYEGDVSTIKELKSTEVVLGEATAIEEKGYGGVIGIVEEEKLTEEVGLREACTIEEKWHEGAVGMMEEEKPTEVGLGEASVVKEKGNEDDAGIVKDKVLGEEVGLQEKREEKGKEQDGVGTTEFQSENLLPSAYPSVAVVPEPSKIGIEQSSEFASDVKDGGNRGDIGLMEEKKPVEQIERREENTTEEKSKKEDDVDSSVHKLSQNVCPSNNVVLEEQENSVKQSSLSLEYAYLLKGNECGERVEMVEEEKLTEDAGLGKLIEEVQNGEETGDTAALEREKLLSGGYASLPALLEVHRVESEPSLEFACDVKNSGNIGGIGLVGEEKQLEEMVKREEEGTEENEYSVGAAARGFSRSVCPSVGVVLEGHVDQVKQSNSSSESAAVVKEKGHEGGVEMIKKKKPTEGMDVGEEIEKQEGKEYESVYTAAMETEKVSPSAYPSKSAAPEVCETEIGPSSLSSEYASFVEDDGEGIGINLVEEVQPTKETLMEERQEAENKVMKQEGVGSENKHQLQSAEPIFVDVVSAVQKIEAEKSGMSLCYSSVVKQNESGGHIEVLEENIFQSDEADMKEEREVLVGGKEGEGDSVVDPKNDEALSNVDDVVADVATEVMVESEPSSFNSDYVSAVEYQSLDMAETESRSSIEHGLDLRPGLKVVAVDTQVPVSSDDEGLYSEDKLWEQIFAIRTIMGYKVALHLSPIEELKALFLFTGVNPPASIKDDSDLMELNEKLQFLKSVIGVQ